MIYRQVQVLPTLHLCNIIYASYLLTVIFKACAPFLLLFLSGTFLLLLLFFIIIIFLNIFNCYLDYVFSFNVCSPFYSSQ